MIPLKDNLSCRVFPIATILLILLNVVAFGIEMSLTEAETESFFQTWAVVPAKVTHAFQSGEPALIGMAVLSILTAMFLHGGPAHILGNMIYLQAFGRSVEGRLGPVRFLLLYLIGGFAAWGLHWYSDPLSDVPALGASGAIAAVLGMYLCFYPKADILTLFPPIFVGVIRAYWLLIGWFALQLLWGVSGSLNPEAGGGVAYWAHIGGYLCGVVIASAWALLTKDKGICYVPLKCDHMCSEGGCTKSGRFGMLGLGFFTRKHRHSRSQHLTGDSSSCGQCHEEDTTDSGGSDSLKLNNRSDDDCGCGTEHNNTDAGAPKDVEPRKDEDRSDKTDGQ